MTALSLPQLSAAEDSIQLKPNAVREAKSMGHLRLRVTYNFSNNHKAKINKPFVGSSNPHATFTPHYQTYHLEGEAYQPKNDDEQYRNKTSQKWTYNNPNKKGFYGTFTEFPKYIENG